MPLHINTENSRKQTLAWHGAFWVQHSLALVNRELTLALLQNADFVRRFDLTLDHWETPTFDPTEEPRFAPLAALPSLSAADAPAITLRHRWPPEFALPASGSLAVIQPWEFGSLPRDWVREMGRSVSEAWVYTQWGRQCYLDSGVAPEMVHVVPLGVNTARFSPDTVPFDWASHSATRDLRPETFKFLFVGGTIARKGIDALLDAYDRAFTSQDDVVLIIKDFGTDSFYAHQGAFNLIRALQNKPGGAKIVYLNENFSEDQIAGLYAACDCLTHPYRGEGYGLPIAEAMACGKPTIVTNYGAALDFANDANAYLVPATLQTFPEARIGDIATVARPFWAQPDRDALIETLRGVVANREEASARGRQAAADIVAHHTWTQAADIAAARLIALADANPVQSGTFTLGAAAGQGGLKIGGAFPSELAATLQASAYERGKQDGLAHCRASRWQEAALLLQTCLEEQPADVEVVNALAAARFRLGDAQSAIALLQQGLEQTPDQRDLHHNLAFMLLETGRGAEAITHALASFASTPDDPNLRRTLERARDAALTTARKLLRSAPAKRRDQARRDPQYRALMTAYQQADTALISGSLLASPPARPLKERGGRAEVEPLSVSTDGLPTGTLAVSSPLPFRGGAGGEAQQKESRLSLCMIVKNEERFLRGCLESVKGMVDEIVVVDTGSTDSTLDIAREFGAVIVEHAWNDDFSEARNVSLAHATGDWALWLDADEEIAPDSGPAWRNLIEQAEPHVGGFMVRFNNYLSATNRETKGEIAVHHAVRLFRRLPGVKFEGRIHEQNLRSLQALGYIHAMTTDPIVIDHWGYAGEIMTLRNKHERFIRMLKREVEECRDSGFHQFHLFNLGNAYFNFGEMENAAHYLGLAAEDAKLDEEYTVTLFTEWATALHRLGRSEEGLEVCERADKMGVRHPGVEFSRGYCLLHGLHYGEAEQSFRAALALGAGSDATHQHTGDRGVSTFKGEYGLALALVGQNRYTDALACCLRAIEHQPGMVEARYLAAIAYTELGEKEQAAVQLKALLSFAPDHMDAHHDLANLLCEREQWADALPHARTVALTHSRNADAQSRYARVCEQVQLWKEARDAYEQLQILCPDSPEICTNLGRMQAAVGQDALAIDTFSEAIALDPEYANAYFNAGDLIYKLGYYDRAAETYLAGLEADPYNAAGFFTLGNAYFQTQKYAAAVLSYQQTLILHPDHVEAKSNLELAQSLLAA